MTSTLPSSSARAMLDRNLALEVVRVTEAAALSSARLMGRGAKNEADEAAVVAHLALIIRQIVRAERQVMVHARQPHRLQGGAFGQDRGCQIAL